MFVDVRQLPDGTTIQTDVCIVGGGLAGITLAKEFLGMPLRVGVLESGGLEPAADTEALNDVILAGERRLSLDFSRARFLGGTTNLWSGHHSPLNVTQLAPRDWVPDSEWPIDAAELAPFLRRAEPYLQLSGLDFNVETWAAATPDFAAVRLPIGGGPLAERLFHRRRILFGEAYRADLASESANVTVFLYATAQALDTDEPARTVERVRVATLDGKRLAVTARVFVLAAGLENARLLLLSNNRRPAGLGNEHDTVGRWFTGLLNLVSGRVLLARDTGFHRFYDIDGWHDPAFPTHTDTVVGLELAPDLQARERIGNYVAFVGETYRGEYDAAFLSLRRIVSQLKRGQMPDSLASDIATILRDPGSAAMGLYGQLSGSAGTRQYRLHHLFEQVPNPESRLTLTSERDRLGLPKMRVDWRLSELDKRTLLSGQTQVAQAFGAAGVGRLQVDPALEEAPWPDTLRHTGAFTGTTRASEDPRRGVVDRNGRVHGMSNLYITGASVFPTGVGLAVGWPIVALAIRLADYLKQ